MRRGERAQMVGHAFRQPQPVMIVIAEGGGPPQQGDILHRGQLGHGLFHPVGGRAAADADAVLAFREQPAAHLRLFVGEDDPRPGPACRQCGCKASGTATGDQHVAMGVAVLVCIRVRPVRRAAKAGHAADRALITHPAALRPHEGLVVEAGRDQRRGDIVHLTQIEGQRGEAVLAGRHQPVIDLDLRRAQVRLGMVAEAELDQRVRLLRPGGEDAARPVIFEAAPDQMHAIGDQRRGQRVAGMALIAIAVEQEGEAARPVDPAAGGKAVRLAHWRTSGFFSPGL